MNHTLQISDRLIQKLQIAKSVVAFTGAGISAESGVPTFRGDDGLWKKFKPEELANFDSFMRNPDLVWQWYHYRRQVIESVQPNQGHYALVTMEKIFSSFTVITQNVDNLHRRAGNTVVHELHGNIERNYCILCGTYYSDIEAITKENVPRCTSCGGLIRPDVVWFGEMLPVESWNNSVSAAEFADVFFSIGTSTVVHPAASLPSIAKRAGAYVVEINLEPTEFSQKADEVLLGKSGEILPCLVHAIHQSTFKQN